MARIQETSMSNLYLDEIEKIKYYKQKILDKYIDQGIIPNKEKVQTAMDRIDKKIAVFSQSYIKSGSEFDVTKFNEQKQDIYQDLVILYTVLYKLIEERIDKVQERIYFSLNNLTTKAEQFKFLVDSESVAIYGKTIFYQVSNFNQTYENGQIVIDLGAMDIPSGSYLACLFRCEEVDPSQIEFSFDGQYSTSSYQYDKQYLKLLGNYAVETTEFTNEDSIFGKDLIDINTEVSEQNRYDFYLNKNKIKIKNADNVNTSYKNFTQGIAYQSLGREEITFYVYGATYIVFDLQGTPNYTNFSGNQITTPKQRQKIVIKTNNKFAFDLKTDGTIYADKTFSQVQDERLKLIQDFTDVTDYMVETIRYGDDIHFDNVSVIVDKVTDTLLDIGYIVIKQTQITELDNE